ncbi:Glycosyl transferase [Streptococcus pneumoniae]|nr:Glycosyl transferase [Streptococcus pneumoniae]VSM02768.1 Glycosyl transferase [Streptococcus pneumoniae]VSO68643.1 Glycosyl transferase [Streptococcus pneumoniae]VSQ74816.1 Glycosyl transferase [Streptococcus pneumoniae]
MTDKASKKAIVLGADSNYMDKVETTIKSVCSHNRDIRFYIFNSDFPTEWFQLMNKRLSVLNSEIINIKITDDTISHFHLPTPHLSSATYLRYFIPNFVFEKKVLYLDSDIVVTSSLTALFDIDLDGYPLGVVPDIPTTDEEFNSGVLLIDTNRWREEDIYRQLFELTIAHHEHVYGDQGIFNILFKDRWKRLDITYNLQVGVDAHRYYMGDYERIHMKAIVLAGDKNYLTPILTTIKSILYYNQNVKIYILHQDIPSDWLQELKIQVEKLGSVVEGIYIGDAIDSEWKHKRIYPL